MINPLTKQRIAKHRLLLNLIFLLLSLCIVNSSFADEKEVEDFPWEIFYPAFIKKSIDKDKDGFTKEQGDCNDSNPSINPDATEICGDGIDQDCSGSDLVCQQGNGIDGTWEGGMFPGHYIIFEVEDINGENYITFARGSYVAIGCINDQYIWESNDLQIKIVNNECHIYFPDDINFGDGRGMELHIYFDSDTELHGTWVGETFCEPLIEGTLRAYHCIDKDNDGYDSCNECDDDNADINRDADEICDGVDNDCDGEIDEGLFYPDKDKDGYGDATAVGQSCPVPEGYVSGNIDCNDNNSSVKPGAVEIPGDGIDQNCDGEIDEASSSRPRFTDLSDGTVRDNDSGLIWLNDANCSELAGINGFGQADWETAKDAAAVLESGICSLTDGSFAGDWRLPTKDEWREFVDRGFVDPALCNEYGSAIWTEGDAFVGVPHELGISGHTDYWSSTEVDAHAAWMVHLSSGSVGYAYYNKGATYYVWPVRSDN